MSDKVMQMFNVFDIFLSLVYLRVMFYARCLSPRPQVKVHEKINIDQEKCNKKNTSVPLHLTSAFYLLS